MKSAGLKQTQFLSEASKKWNALSSEQKQKYVEIAQKQKDAYNQIKATHEGGVEGDGDDDEANQLRSKTFSMLNAFFLQENSCSYL